MVLFEKGALTRPHLDSLSGVRVVEAENVEHAVHREQREFVVECSGVIGSCLPSDVGTDHDVTE
jgi:hypothetical protein